MKKRVCSIVAVVLLVSSVLAGCSQQVAPAAEKVLTFARPEDIPTWDPHDNMAIAAWIVNRCIYDTLIEITPEGKIIPGLATEWSCSADALEWTFKLRAGVKFHNGEAFDSGCVKATIDRFVNETLVQSGQWATLAGVDTPDPNTAIIRLKTPDAALLSTLSTTAIIPAKTYKEQGKKLFNHPIGSGPFEFVEWLKGDKTEIKKFTGYWGQKPAVDRIIYRPLMEGSTRVAGLRTGEIDVADTLPVDDVMTLSSDPNVKVIRIPAWDVITLGVKCDQKPLDDVRVRRALSIAIDREAIVKFIYEGGKAWDSLIPEGVIGYDPNLPPELKDLDEARRLLEEAGYSSDVAINFIVPEGWFPKGKEVAEALRGYWQEAGFSVNLMLMDGAAYLEKRGAGNYNVFLASAAYTNGDPDKVFTTRVAQDTYVTGGISQELTNAVLNTKSYADPAERTIQYHKVLELIRRDYAPLLTVCQTEFICGVRNGVSGVQIRGDKVTDLRWGAKQ